MLLTGDGHGADVLRGLERARRLDRSGRIHVDVLKVPHHGSEHNLDPDFAARVTADHYVFCANGEHANPDLRILRALFDARDGGGRGRPAVHVLVQQQLDGVRGREGKEAHGRGRGARRAARGPRRRADGEPVPGGLELRGRMMAEFDAAAVRSLQPVSQLPDTPPAGGIGLCLSGGGYRAMLFHLGSLWRLNDAGALRRLDRISSVSGGSITAATLGLRWRELDWDPRGRAGNFERVVVAPVRGMAGETIDLSSVLEGCSRSTPSGSAWRTRTASTCSATRRCRRCPTTRRARGRGS